MNYPADFTEEMRTQGICGVLAIAVASGITMAQAHETCKRNMLPHQKRHVRSTYDDQIIASLAEHGRTVVEQPVSRQTVRRFVDNVLHGDRYLVFSSGHVFLVENGMVMDQSGCSSVLEHRIKRCFVQKAYRIY